MDVTSDSSDLTKAIHGYRTKRKSTSVAFEGITDEDGIIDAYTPTSGSIARPRRDSGVTGGLNDGNTPTSGSITP